MRTSNILRNITAGAVAFALLGVGTEASAQQAVIVEDDERGASGPDPFLLNSGLIVTGLSYTPALIVAINSDRSEDKYLYAPFVGPWLDLAAREDSSKLDNTLLVVDGVFQTIGLVQIVASLMWVDDGDDDDDVGAADAADSSIDVASVAPARFSEGGYGLMAAGRF
jgi:hypothetical protein